MSQGADKELNSQDLMSQACEGDIANIDISSHVAKYKIEPIKESYDSIIDQSEIIDEDVELQVHENDGDAKNEDRAEEKSQAPVESFPRNYEDNEISDAIVALTSLSQDDTQEPKEGSKEDEEIDHANKGKHSEEQPAHQDSALQQLSPPAKRKRKDHQGGEDQPRKRTSPKKAKKTDVVAPQTDWEDTTLDADEADVKESYAKLDFRVHFGPLSSSTSNVKLSFRIQENMEVTIKDLSQHIKPGMFFDIKNCRFIVNDVSTAQNDLGKTFFGGVITIGMDVVEDKTSKAQKASVRLFGFSNKDPERRHKAQFSGKLADNDDLFPIFCSLFGQEGRMIEDLQLAPNPVFSSTDNAIMDPRFGFDVERMLEIFKVLQAKRVVEKYNKQMTGAINFTFFVERGDGGRLAFSATVQKSGSIQLMLVKNPRRTRLETMKFLLSHCRECIVRLESLNLNKRTLDKRRLARKEHVDKSF